MFGFLRRKKPEPEAVATPAAPAVDAPAPQADAPTAGAGATDAGNADARIADAEVADAGAADSAATPAEPAQAGRLAGFFGRLLRTTPEPAAPEELLPAQTPAPEAADPDAAASPGENVALTPAEPVEPVEPVAAAPAEPVPAEPVPAAPAPAASMVEAPADIVPPGAVSADSVALRPISLPSRFTRTARSEPSAFDLSTPVVPAAAPLAAPPILMPDAPVASDEPLAIDTPQAGTSERASWVARLKQGLSKTRTNLGTLFVGVKVDEALFEDLEGALLMADAGVEATDHLLTRLREVVRKERLTEGEQVRRALKDLVAELLLPLEQPIDIDRADPLVMMIAGVNGAGKTTSIGKLARHLQRERKTVLLAAGDTFRAAAREQLAQWGERNGVAVIAQQGGDPAAVAFDAVAAAQARRIETVIVDTAGRLPTQLHLMQELKKVRRVLAKAMPDAPHETLLVLDGNTGQNALTQVQAFDDAVPLTGLVVTKLDGTAKGGALIALAHTRRDNPIPVYFIGVGEGIDDLQAFSSREFADALLD